MLISVGLHDDTNVTHKDLSVSTIDSIFQIANQKRNDDTGKGYSWTKNFSDTKNIVEDWLPCIDVACAKPAYSNSSPELLVLIMRGLSQQTVPLVGH